MAQVAAFEALEIVIDAALAALYDANDWEFHTHPQPNETMHLNHNDFWLKQYDGGAGSWIQIKMWVPGIQGRDSISVTVGCWHARRLATRMLEVKKLIARRDEITAMKHAARLIGDTVDVEG